MNTEARYRSIDLKDPSLLTDKAYISGRWVESDENGITVTDPFDLRPIGRVPSLNIGEVRQAIKDAALAMASWKNTPAKSRATILRRWHDLIVENADDLALILTSEQGKPLAESKAEIVSNAAYLEWFGEEAKRIEGDYMAGPSASQRILTMKQPIGVCAAITPWNFPNGMITRKIGPALAAGCAIVLKPASQTPLSALALAVLGERAGVPSGLFSVVTGNSRMIGEEFAANPVIAKITFTGSTEVGRWLMAQAANQIKRLSLELGGNAPFIVFDDADIDAAVDGAIASKFRNAGQTCVCANRIYVQEPVVQEFTAKLAAKVKALKLGRGTESGVSIGPLIDDRAVEKLQEHIDDALALGGTLVTGGKRSELGGTFYEPTIISGMHQSMKVAKEETFAPLAPIFTFITEEEAIRYANDTEYGLASYIYARDFSRILRVGEQLEYGMVGVNS
ncbi:Glutarate-semialdehyde dehydrogenase DavD [Ensifer adhaerens]|nr:Glutarate-semialdehyde dehydrogenase DavD [Ensifer adhaerens]